LIGNGRNPTSLESFLLAPIIISDGMQITNQNFIYHFYSNKLYFCVLFKCSCEKKNTPSLKKIILVLD
jgi:hypothetical protein